MKGDKTTFMTRRNAILCLFVGLIGSIILAWLWKNALIRYYAPAIYSTPEVPEQQVAIVFGAQVYRSGRLSGVLRDRMDTAIALYERGVVQKLLLSGDNSVTDYDEPGAMMDYAIRKGVKVEDIQPDYAGRRTYDTCYRARHIFLVESAVLVTQEYHLPRALFTCNNLGVQAVGAKSDIGRYYLSRWFNLRETGATMLALWDVIWQQPAPILGEPIPLDVSGIRTGGGG